MTNLTYFECFNEKLKEFLNDLVSAFPELKHLSVMKNGLNLAINLDVKLPQKIFNDNIRENYETRIVNKDEQFFLSEDYEHIANKHNLDLDIVSKLKGIWKTLDADNKEVIWKYLQVLVVLNKRCLNTKSVYN
jgi:hypothetical protein